MSERCPCCGRAFPPLFEIRGWAQRRLVEALCDHVNGLSRHRLMDLIYHDDPYGGPESPNIIAVLAGHANKQLAAYGYRITCDRGRGSQFVLREINADPEFKPAATHDPQRLGGPQSAGAAGVHR